MRERYSETDLAARITELADDIAPFDPDVAVCVLSGGIHFFADLVRRLPGDPSIDFLAIRPFEPGTGRLAWTKDLDLDVSGQRVLIVEDLIDTGLRINTIVDHVRSHGATEVRVAALFDRPSARVVPVTPDHVGFSIGREFIVGFGSGIGHQLRNLPAVFETDPVAAGRVREDDVADLYRGRLG